MAAFVQSRFTWRRRFRPAGWLTAAALLLAVLPPGGTQSALAAGSCTALPCTYPPTNSEVTFTVPASGVSHVTVTAIGAPGGGAGGPGALVTTMLAVSPNQVLHIRTGGPGSSGGFNGGGAGGGGGGGASGVYGATGGGSPMVVAGGGGGGGGGTTFNPCTGAGGAGGTPKGGDGESCGYSGGGFGSSGSFGGTGGYGYPCGTCSGAIGGAGAGGAGGSYGDATAGGGGGGYYGGGGGGYDSDNLEASGGGGGASFAGGSTSGTCYAVDATGAPQITLANAGTAWGCAVSNGTSAQLSIGGTGNGTPNSLTATAGPGTAGEGTLTLTEYAANPTSTTLSGGTGYVDVSLPETAGFSSVAVVDCDTGGRNNLDWYDGATWKAVSPAPTVSGGCLHFTLNNSSSPTLGQLTGTPFATSASTTRALLSHAGVSRHGRDVTVRWTVAGNAGITGFYVSAGTKRLNSRLIPVHLSRSYRYVIRRPVAGVIRVHIVLGTGQELSAPIR